MRLTGITGMFEVAIWLLTVYLIFKGVEIFQIAYMSTREEKIRKNGIFLGAVMIVLAIIATLIFNSAARQIAASISNPTP